jgi:hypothetical protein
VRFCSLCFIFYALGQNLSSFFFFFFHLLCALFQQRVHLSPREIENAFHGLKERFAALVVVCSFVVFFVVAVFLRRERNKDKVRSKDT